jgi:hypothetical protein
MEAILDLYAEAYDPLYPAVCFDECPYQLIGHTRIPVPAAPGRRRRYDYEVKREGTTCNLFMIFCPRQGWRHVTVTARRTKQDFAHQMKALVDVYFPQALKVRLVLDNLNTRLLRLCMNPLILLKHDASYSGLNFITRPFMPVGCPVVALRATRFR